MSFGDGNLREQLEMLEEDNKRLKETNAKLCDEVNDLAMQNNVLFASLEKERRGKARKFDRKRIDFRCGSCKTRFYIKFKDRTHGEWTRYMPPAYCPRCGEKQATQTD